MRCPYCGADKLTSVTRKDGYSLKKGLAGAAILGPVGAVAGIDGKEKRFYHCPMCGEDVSAPMSSGEAMDIFNAIIKNDTSRLRQYKTKYRNIEWSDNNPAKVQSDHMLHGSVRQEDKKSKMTGNPFDDIKNYLREVDSPVSFNELLGAIVTPRCDKRVVRNTVLALVEQGLIKYRSGYFALVRDIDEMVRLKEKGSENKAIVEAELNQQEKEKKIAQKEQEKEELKQLSTEYTSLLQTEILNIKEQLAPLETEYHHSCANQKELIEKQEPYCTKTKRCLQTEEITLKEKIQEIEGEKRAFLKEISEKEEEIASLSFLQGKKKKQIMAVIDSVTEKVHGLDKELKTIKEALEQNNKLLLSVESDYNKKIEKAVKKTAESKKGVDSFKAKIEEREKEIEEITNGEYSSKRFKAYVEANREKELSQASEDGKFLKTVEEQLINQLLKYSGPVSKEKLWNDIHELGSESMHLQIITNQRLSAILRQLSNKGMVVKTKKGTSYYFEVL